MNKNNSARIANKLVKDKWELVGQRTPLDGGEVTEIRGVHNICHACSP